jgi:glutamine amidotransferase
VSKVAIIDYGMGNLRSVAKAIEHVATADTVVVTADPAEVLSADRVVFPGQGAMPDCMRELDARGLRPAVLEAAGTSLSWGSASVSKCSSSTAKRATCLARYLQGRSPPLSRRAHGGRRRLAPEGAPHGLERGLAEAGPPPVGRHRRRRPLLLRAQLLRRSGDPAIVAATTDYGIPFTGAVAQANIFAIQFHPEKSAHAGLQSCRTSCPGSPDLPSPSHPAVPFQLLYRTLFLCC